MRIVDLFSFRTEYWDLTWPCSVSSFSHAWPQWTSLLQSPALNILKMFPIRHRHSSDFGLCVPASPISSSFFLSGVPKSRAFAITLKGICLHNQRHSLSQSKAFAETIDFSRRQDGFLNEETKRFQQIGVHECLDKTDNDVQWIF